MDQRAQPTAASQYLRETSGPWADLALTLPIFLLYHLLVVFLDVRNAADLVTRELVQLSSNSLPAYGGLTLVIGAVFVGVLVVAGREHELAWQRFAWIAIEGVIYASMMRFAAAYVVGRLHLGGVGQFARSAAAATEIAGDRFAGLVMSLGAGFYEEVAFRVLLFGVGLKLLQLFVVAIDPLKRVLVALGWATLCAAVFSGWHYVGALGDPFEMRSFVFRWVCGLVFTAIYVFRGFAPVVWTHALYDIWVLVF
jgi:hypothetical protein